NWQSSTDHLCTCIMARITTSDKSCMGTIDAAITYSTKTDRCLAFARQCAPRTVTQRLCRRSHPARPGISAFSQRTDTRKAFVSSDVYRAQHPSCNKGDYRLGKHQTGCVRTCGHSS